MECVVTGIQTSPEDFFLTSPLGPGPVCTLSWAGKQEGMSFEVQNVSLHIHGIPVTEFTPKANQP